MSGKYFVIFQNSIILSNLVILCLDREPISEKEYHRLQLGDFVLLWLFIFEFGIKILSFGIRKSYFPNLPKDNEDDDHKIEIQGNTFLTWMESIIIVANVGDVIARAA